MLMSENTEPKVYKVGAVVVNSSGTFAKVLQVKHGVHICTDWVENIEALEKLGDVGNVRFNESARVACGIKLASQGSVNGNGSGTKTDAEIAEQNAKADAALKAEVEAQEKLNSGEDKSEYTVIKGVEFPRGTAHDAGSVIELTEAAAASFADGLIEKVETPAELDTDKNKTEDGKPKGFMTKVLGN